MRILLAEDHHSISSFVCKGLRLEGYVVDLAEDGRTAWTYLQQFTYDIAILDVMMPEMDGFEIVQALRKSGNDLPVIFLTAKDTVENRIHGLSIGADDYVVKPFDFGELLARIDAVLRRADTSTDPVLSAGDLLLYPARRQAFVGSKEIHLTPKEFSLLQYLLENRTRVISRDQLVDELWDISYDGNSGVIDVFIHNLREKIDVPFNTTLIQTVRGRGYVIR